MSDAPECQGHLVRWAIIVTPRRVVVEAGMPPPVIRSSGEAISFSKSIVTTVAKRVVLGSEAALRQNAERYVSPNSNEPSDGSGPSINDGLGRPPEAKTA